MTFQLTQYFFVDPLRSINALCRASLIGLTAFAMESLPNKQSIMLHYLKNTIYLHYIFLYNLQKVRTLLL